jgi:penicillin-binding protein 2
MVSRDEKLLFKLVLMAVFFGSVAAFSPPPASAQTKKNAARQTAQNKKTDQKDSPEKSKVQGKSKTQEQARSQEKSKKPTKADLARQAEIARQQQAAREAAAERQQAALEAKRRREQAAREARQRQVNFERGLRTETIENISADNIEGEDLEVRRAAVNALGSHAGTVVVMEPQTGKVLSIVNQDWGIRKGFKPCSTIKLVTATGGINEGLIDDAGRIQTARFPMELNDALAFSNNTYFQKVGVSGLGNAKMISYARSLGLGEPTGINAPGESAGKLPFGNSNPRIYSHGDDFEVTPLQLAVMVSALSNGGKIVVPQIPRAGYSKANFRGQMKREVTVARSTLQGVLPGMVGAVNYGTARRSGGSNYAAAGKTGSCIGGGSWLGLFASVAPIVNPQLAVVVVTRGSNERGKYASAIAGKVYEALAYRMKGGSGSNQPLVAKIPEILKPKPQVSAKVSASVDTEEGEDSDEGDVNPAAASVKRANPKKGGEDSAETVVENKNAAKSNPKSENIFGTTVIQVGRKVTEQNRRENSRPRIVLTDNK